MWNFQKVFLIILSLFGNLKLMNVLFIHEKFLVYKLETFTNCKEVKHVMIMIIVINYILLSYEMFDQQKILSPPPSPPFLKESTPPPILSRELLRIQNVKVPSIFPTLKIFPISLSKWGICFYSLACEIWCIVAVFGKF